MTITPTPPGNISPPNSLGAENAGSISAPNNLTGETGGGVQPPNNLSSQAAGSVSVPNDLSSQASGSVNPPNSLTPVSGGSLQPPNNIGSESAGSISVPNNLSSEASGVVQPPVSLTPLEPGQWPASSGPTPPTRQDFYYYFGATGSQTLRTNETIIPDVVNEDFSIGFTLGTFGFTGIDQTFVSQSVDNNIAFWIYADPDNMLNIQIGTTELTTSVDVNGEEKFLITFTGTNYEVFVDDVSVESGTLVRTAPASYSPSTKIGSRQVTGGYTNTLQAVMYNVYFIPIGASFVEHLYLLDENSDSTIEYNSQTQLSTWVNYNAANWQGTP